jgi:hypothetical protein
MNLARIWAVDFDRMRASPRVEVESTFQMLGDELAVDLSIMSLGESGLTGIWCLSTNLPFGEHPEIKMGVISTSLRVKIE